MKRKSIDGISSPYTEEFQAKFSYTVDHIMPQGERLPETWKAELGPDWAQTWQSLRHTLGNLTLTAFNPEMGNRPFRDKRDAEKGYRDSPLRLNADLRQTDRWDGDTIRARGARLANDAVEIWKRPVLPNRVLEPYKTPRAGAGHYTIEHHPHLRPGAPMHDLFEAVRHSSAALFSMMRQGTDKRKVSTLSPASSIRAHRGAATRCRSPDDKKQRLPQQFIRQRYLGQRAPLARRPARTLCRSSSA